MASDLMTVAALGRPFTLGMLYDARKDELIPGFALWDEKTLQEHTTKSSQHSSGFEISASDSIESRSSLLDIEASLKASFMSGLIEVEGSAKYLNDTKKFKNQSRVTCQYKATTNFEQLSVSQLLSMNPQQKDLIEMGLATHVVTGILYGADAFFVFDSEKLDSSNVQEIQGSMKAVIKKIPELSIEGGIDINLNDEEKALTNKFSCKFYGDFILKSNPTTFEDAVKTYAELPQLLGGNGENSVPVKVWLTPLKNLDSSAAELMTGISVEMVWKVETALEELREIETRCNDSLDEGVVEDFPQIREELRRFQKLCSNYASYLQKTIAAKLPLIREGKEDESELKKLFEDRTTSPFSQEKLTKWLDHKERVINVIKSCVDMMEGSKIVPNQSDLDTEVMAPGVHHALCFAFTSLDSADPCLDIMVSFLKSPDSGSTSEEPWYYSDEVFIKMRQKAENFHNLTKALKNNSNVRFLVSAKNNWRHTGATIYHYKNGILVTDDFSEPDIPHVESITDRADLIWYDCELTLDLDTAHPKLTFSEGNKKVTNGGWQSYPSGPQRFDWYQQVLCKDRLSGRHYWEVEWSGYVRAAVTYIGIGRKSWGVDASLGHNKLSWVFESYPDCGYCQVHNGNAVNVKAPCVGFKRLGVYLDWPAGTLSFYMVSSNKLSHLHTFYTQFYDAVYPGFMVGYPRPNMDGELKLL